VCDGTALMATTKDSGALTGIELMRIAAASAHKGIGTVHGIAFEWRVPTET